MRTVLLGVENGAGRSLFLCFILLHTFLQEGDGWRGGCFLDTLITSVIHITAHTHTYIFIETGCIKITGLQILLQINYKNYPNFGKVPIFTNTIFIIIIPNDKKKWLGNGLKWSKMTRTTQMFANIGP